jgi:hypothetical protein
VILRTRTDPSSPIPSLPALIARLIPIMDMIMSIPPIEPTSYIRVQYLLRFTSGLREYFSGYSITGTGVVEEGKKVGVKGTPRIPSTKVVAEASLRNLDELLRFVDKLDSAWLTVLKGGQWYHGEPVTRDDSDAGSNREQGRNDPEDEPLTTPVSITDK